MNTSAIRFSRKDSAQFFKTLNKRVNDYFNENKIKKNRELEIVFENGRNDCPFSCSLFSDPNA